MTAKAPVFRERTFKQECQIAEGIAAQKLPQPVAGYEFNNGKRKFADKVEKTKAYD